MDEPLAVGEIWRLLCVGDKAAEEGDFRAGAHVGCFFKDGVPGLDGVGLDVGWAYVVGDVFIAEKRWVQGKSWAG